MRLECVFVWGVIWGLTGGGVGVILMFAAIVLCAPGSIGLDKVCPYLYEEEDCGYASSRHGQLRKSDPYLLGHENVHTAHRL